MLPTVIAVLLVLFVVLFVGWFVWSLMRPRSPAEPQDESEVLAPIGRDPRSNAGAVALEEPDDNDPPDLIGRKP